MSTEVAEARRAEVVGIIDAATRWAKDEKGVAGIGLAGSWAREEARDDSDVDLIVLVDDPSALLDDEDWHRVLNAQLVRSESFGVVSERRLRRPSGLEIEIGITDPCWAATDPVDRGTHRVVSEGFQILYERGSLLSDLVAAVRATST